MDFRHLRYFQAVAEELSFSRAAERLRIAQPALSRAVQELERELGALLFKRNRRLVRLTPAGSVLLRESSILFERWEEAIRAVRRTESGQEGELRVGYIGPPTQGFLGRLLLEYRKRYPLVSIHLEERTPERVWEMLAKGRLTVAFTRPVPTLEALGLRTLLLRKERLGIVVPKEHPLARRRSVSWKELNRESLIVLARREGVGTFDAILANCRRQNFSPRIAYTPSLIGTVLSYVEAGAGVGILPECVATPELKLRFIPLTPSAEVPLVLAWRRDEETPSAQRFRELVAEWMKSGELWVST